VSFENGKFYKSGFGFIRFRAIVIYMHNLELKSASFNPGGVLSYPRGTILGSSGTIKLEAALPASKIISEGFTSDGKRGRSWHLIS
jgi:hypothetical protein